jgi:hypothetical protein
VKLANKVVIKAIIVFVALISILNLFFSKYMFNFGWNMIRQSTFETENFIIDLPKFHWFGQYRRNSTLPFFMGISIDLSKNVFFKGSTLFDDKKYTVSPIIVFDDLNENSLKAIETICDVSFAKSTQKINNFEMDIYDCLTAGYESNPARYYVYKNEVFHTYTFIDAFKPQYDKFFEGVWLKE